MCVRIGWTRSELTWRKRREDDRSGGRHSLSFAFIPPILSAIHIGRGYARRKEIASSSSSFSFFYDIRKGRREMKCVNGSKMFGLREKKSGTNWLALAGITQLVTSHVRLLLRFRARLSFPPQMLSQRTPGCTSDTLQLYCLFSRAFSSSTFSFSPFPLSFSFYLGAAAI